MSSLLEIWRNLRRKTKGEGTEEETAPTFPSGCRVKSYAIVTGSGEVLSCLVFTSNWCETNCFFLQSAKNRRIRWIKSM